ncbi:GntR family transcriptional regulator [Roseibium sp. MMSF_3544]|uniref:GntR family transcriptional regulator n=1 Tax=unclassified Roseibium TaxID=2629323 RepID=UPI00273F2FC6|nr:GntR family transcriptional regulator [Roseibium sp. MMSF_3544]
MAVVSKKITQAIRDKILSGEFLPGEHLREQPLAEMFKASRTPVRVALTANAQDGLLEYEPNKGFLVRSVSHDDVRQAFEMRSLVEGAVCRRVAERGMSLEAEREARYALELVDKLTDKNSVVDSDLRSQWRTHNQKFHSAILSSSDNKFFDNALEDVKKIPSVFPPVIGHYTLNDLRTFNDQHRMILECILRRSGMRAEALMKEHIFSAYSTVSKNFDDGVFFS